MKTKRFTTGRAAALALVIGFLGGVAFEATGQQATWPNCGFICTANDVEMTGAYANLPVGSCEPGSNVTATIRGEFRANATRYAVWVLADVYVDGSVSKHINQCVAGTISAPGGTLSLGTVSWPCGATLELRNVIVSWTASSALCSDTPLCTDRKAKCSSPSLGTITVSTPLVVDFSSDAPQCLGQPIAFTNLTTGGRTPYSYEWSFGDGSPIDKRAAPTHVYTAPGTYTVTLAVTEAGGSTDSHSRTVTVRPLPSASASNDGPYCPGQTIQLSSSGGTSYAWSGPSGFTSTTQNPSIPAASATKAGTYTVIVTDASGCSASASTQVVVDSTPPTLTVPANLTVPCGGSVLPVATGTASATDNVSPAPTVTYADQASLTGCGGTGTILRTWTATDACGNSSSGTQTITVSDTSAPTLTLPPNVTVACGHSTLPTATGQATAVDGCSTPTVTYADQASLNGCGGTGTILRTWTATDACGNSSSGTQTITVSDTTAPTLTLPPNVTVACGHSTSPSATGQATAVDGCSTPTVTYADQTSLTGCGGTGTILRTWTATDACGNSSSSVQTITVADQTPPVLTVPPDDTVQSGESTDPAATGTASATDTCSSPTVTYSDESDLSGPGGSGTILRTWTAVDACGNTSSGVQTIVVTAEPQPTHLSLTPPADVTVQSGEPTDPSETGLPATSTTCPTPPSVTYSDDADLTGCDGTGTILRTWTATDACGNTASGVQTITVVDIATLSLLVPADVTVQSGEPTDPSATGYASAYDPDAEEDEPVVVTYSDDANLTGCDGTGTILRTWTAVDACGNSSSGVQTITVIDTAVPSLVVPADVTVQSGESTEPSATGYASAYDPDAEEDEPVLVTYSDDADLTGCDGTGIILRTWTAADACGNSSSGVQTITVIDVAIPSLVIPADVTVQAGEPTDPSATGYASAYDPDAEEDEPVAVSYSDDVDLSGCGGTGVILRTWTAADACGNASSGLQTIVVIDATPPEILVPPDVTLTCGSPIDPEFTGQATARHHDQSEANRVEITYRDLEELSACDGTGRILRTWAASDACGNRSVGHQAITIVGSCAPRVIISEVAWAGTQADSRHEWVELRNLGEASVDLGGWVLRWRPARPETTEDEQWTVVPLGGVLSPAAPATRLTVRRNSDLPASWWLDLREERYRTDILVLERSTDEAVQDLPAGLVYNSAALSRRDVDLSDAGEYIELLDADGCVIDTANAPRIGVGGWVAGDVATTGSMERIDPFAGDTPENWHTNLGMITFGRDANGETLFGTAGSENEPRLNTLAPIEIPAASADPTPWTIPLPEGAPTDGGLPVRLVALPPGGLTPVTSPVVASWTEGELTVAAADGQIPAGAYSVWIRVGRALVYLPIRQPL